MRKRNSTLNRKSEKRVNQSSRRNGESPRKEEHKYRKVGNPKAVRSGNSRTRH